MSVTCTPKRLETHLAIVTQTSAMALAREELEEGTGELLSLYMLLLINQKIIWLKLILNFSYLSIRQVRRKKLTSGLFNKPQQTQLQ